MKSVHIQSLFSLVLMAITISCNPVQQAVNQEHITIHINQVGYLPDSYKSAVVVGGATEYSLVNSETGEVVFNGVPEASKYWEASGENAQILNFSEYTLPGTYHIRIKDVSSHQFEIGPSIYTAVGTAGLKAYYYHRIGIELEKKYAGAYARPSAHPDTTVFIHSSAASVLRPEGTVIAAPGGWYDAGDYNKYIVNSAITVSTMMSLFEHYPESIETINSNIPESSNNVPDLLDEIRYNLEWMLTMQDPADGGVYHKMTHKNFQGMVMPQTIDAERYVVMKTTTATLDFAASTAQASRIYRPYDAAFADACIAASTKAWDWATANPGIVYTQPEDIQTGAYDQTVDRIEDESFWAATELSITTGENYEAPMPTTFRVHEWRDGAALAAMNQLHHNSIPAVKAAFFVLADSLLKEQQASAYDVSNDAFRWGSTSDFLNQAMVLIYAYKLSGDEQYKIAAQSTFDWVMGKNPTGYSFLTGYGDKRAMHVHHRPSEADGIDEPIPGWVVGGPNPENQYDCQSQSYPSQFPARVFLDELCSYSTNEIAINWNAPFVYMAFALQDGE